MVAETIIPLFPLGVVLMPHMLLPLHIFEERYKIMISECIRENREFGIVFFNGSEMKNVGCAARIVKVLKRYENGEMDIMTIGRNRFLMRELYDTKAYLEAKVVYFDDENEAESEDLKELAREGIRFLKELDRMTGIAHDYGNKEELSIKQLSFLIAESEGFTPQEKQKLLEMTSTRDRLQSGTRSLEKVVQRTKLTVDIQKIIKGNGNAKKILHDYNSD